jgi:hypothetical protein
VRIDARATQPKCDQIPLPTDLGPLRSEQAGEISSTLLVGAQSGVMLVDPQNPSDARRYADRAIASPLGFNSVITAAGMIWATHAEAGVVAWNLDDREKPAFSLRPQSSSDAPRNAVAVDDAYVLYSAGGLLLRANPDGSTASVVAAPSAVVFIHVDNDRIAVVRADGSIDHLDRATLARTNTTRHCGETIAAAPLPWLGTTRLLLATAEGPVCCLGFDDPLVTQYASAHRGLRAIAACGDLVAGLSADRQRIILWKSWDGRAPAGEVHIGTIARHRAADVCFA